MNFPLRIVEDYDVDRLQVQVRQRIQPRSTNHPFGLIPVLELVKQATVTNKIGLEIVRS